MDAVNETPVAPEQEQPVVAEPASEQATLGNPEGQPVVEQPTDGGTQPVSPEEPQQQRATTKREDHYVRRLKTWMNTAQQLQASNLELQARLMGVTKPVVETPKPARDQFTNDDEYIQAQVDFQLAKKLPEIQSKIQQSTQQQTAMSSFQVRENEVRKQNPDYDEVIADANDIPVKHQIIVDAIMMSKEGPELRYYLAKNPEIMEDLNAMHPVEAALELGSIRSQLTHKEPAPRVVNRAPAPIRSVLSNGVTVTTSPEKMSMDEFVKSRNQQRRDLGRKY
jgi:hypothetical protein